MPKLQFTRTFAQFTTAFEPAALEALGRDSGFLRRIRDITPMNLIPSLIATLGSGPITTLTELWSGFNLVSGADVEYKTFHDRLRKPAFPVMMDKFVEHLTSQLVLQALRFLPNSPFARFDRILAQDGSSLAVHNALAKVFPGRFNKVSPAAVEIHPTYDVLREAPAGEIWLAPDTYSERLYLPEPTTLAGNLLLADRGYPSFPYMAAVRDAGGFYIMRAKSDKSSVIGYYSNGIEILFAEPVLLPDYIAAHPKKILDLIIRPKTGDYGTFRLVVLPTPKGHTRLFTDLPASDFPAEIVGLAYRLRWQIELMFKDWKSYANLHRWGTADEAITEGLMWASIATSLVKRFMAKAAQMVGKVAVSTLKAARQLAGILPKLVAALLEGNEMAEEAFAEALEVLKRHAKRSNTKRERQIGRQQLGLRPVYGT